MTICPFCKKAVVNADPGAPCPSCGKVDPNRQAPAKAPAASGGDDWDDLEIQRGSAGQAPSGPSSYSGGSMGGFGDDDDHGPGLSLELDTPVRSQAPPVMSAPPPQQPSLPPNSGPRSGGSGGHAPYSGPSGMPQPLPARKTPEPPHQQSSPNVSQPPSSPQVAGQQPQLAPPGVAFAPALAPPPGPSGAEVMIARYPMSPEKWWETPGYAMRVLYRQYELRQDIAALRKKRSPDVALYERALKSHDSTNVAIGLAITIAACTVATFIFFLPVILRFIRDPD